MLTTTAAPNLIPPGHQEPWPLTHSLTLRNAPGAVPHARHFTTGTLFNWNFAGQFLDDVEVVVSELVTNALQACQRDRTTRLCRVRPITLDIRSNFASVVIEVADPIAEPPVLQEQDSSRDGGRGLALVEFFADAWAYYPTDAGKIVWASLTRY